MCIIFLWRTCGILLNCDWTRSVISEEMFSTSGKREVDSWSTCAVRDWFEMLSSSQAAARPNFSTLKSSSSQVFWFSSTHSVLLYVLFSFAKKLAHHCLFSGLITRELSRNFGISLFSRSMSTLSGEEATNFGHPVEISTSLKEYHQNFSASGCNLLQGFVLIYRIYYGVHDVQHKRIQWQLLTTFKFWNQRLCVQE